MTDTCTNPILTDSCLPFVGGQYISIAAFSIGIPTVPTGLTGSTLYVDPDGHTVHVLRNVGAPNFSEYLFLPFSHSKGFQLTFFFSPF